ncbi:MAG: DUF89 family protein [Planctomycetes bacterium]|nr:DUF89 family protein [Planctomycetota bacterium]
MKSADRAPATHLALIERFLALARIPAAEARLLRGELERDLRARLDRKTWIEPHITRFHTEWYREIYRVLGVADPFAEIKRASNALAGRLLAAVRPASLREAIVAAIIANKLDYGALEIALDEEPLLPDDLRDLGRHRLLFDDYEALAARLAAARSLLYIPDNCGEVLFDREVLDWVRRLHPECRVAIAGKEGPMLNDVTAAELRELGFERLGTVLSTGTDAFGAPEEEVSAEFKAAFGAADLVIAKGQAQFEFWTEYAVDKVFHLLHVKIPVVDAVLGRIPEHVDLILDARRYASGKRPYVTGSARDGGRS